MQCERSLVVFSKPARPGRVKTRLIAPPPAGLSAEEAAELHWAFVLDLLERLAAGDFSLRIAWDLAAGETPPDVGLPWFTQHGDGLGERLFDGLSRAAREARWVAAVGSDHPALSRQQVERAFDLLAAGGEVVLGPAVDGGYYLVAVNAGRLDRRLFADIRWSTGAVLAQTLERCRELGLAVDLLSEERDVDTPEDLRRLAAALARGGKGCPRTRRLLDAWGRLTG